MKALGFRRHPGDPALYGTRLSGFRLWLDALRWNNQEVGVSGGQKVDDSLVVNTFFDDVFATEEIKVLVSRRIP